VIDLAGHNFQERDLIKRVMMNLTRRSKAQPQRWIAVRDAFGVGSTVAHALCREFGYDPDEELTR
jgi:hypothetical protein